MNAMTTSTLTLISHHLCPFVQRIAIVLAEKGAAFERVNIDLADKPAWFLAISPLGKVPLLKVTAADGTEAVLLESVPICEYLDETCEGRRLHPADMIARAQHRAWIEFATPTMVDAWGYVAASDAVVGEVKLSDFRARLTRCEAVLGNGRYFAGAEFTMVDVVFAPTFRFFDALGESAATPAFRGFPGVQRWRDELGQRESVIAAVAADYPQRLRERMRRDGALLAA
jgi:glutathione S-transferase